jgi:hypothetical protein
MVDFGNIPQGGSANFVVLAMLSDGTTTSLANAGITCTLTNDSDPSLGAAQVNPDGTAGVVQAGAPPALGQGSFHVTDSTGQFTDSATYEVVAAVTVTGIVITPVAGIKIAATKKK